MMKKTILTLTMLIVFTGCSSDGTEVRSEGNEDIPTEFQIQMTTPVPNEYFQAATQQGTIELLEYELKDHTSASRPTTRKPAYVYLPYGYSPAQKYDIIYLLHGWTGVAQEYFLGRNGNSRTNLVNIFDNLIQRGLCRPFIAVSPTWDKDNRSKGWGESTQEAAVFSQEYVNDLIPAANSQTAYEPYTRTSRISDVMADPAFSDYGRLIFPVNNSYWGGTTLEDLQLTWYNCIDPNKTVEIVNYMKQYAEAGETIFYDIYTEAEKRINPDKCNTGLFFFKGNQGTPFAICNAGGGFSYVGAMHDSFPHALELSKKGYNAFALIYRPSNAYEDLARAITFIYDHADELGVARSGYSLWGGSAGARMAATLANSSYLRQLTGRTDIPQASAVIMQYTGYTTVSQYDSPTYACCGTSDGIASWHTMQSRLESLSAFGIPTEFHSYDGLLHGFGLGTGTVAEDWINDAVRFWEQQSGINRHLDGESRVPAPQRHLFNQQHSP